MTLPLDPDVDAAEDAPHRPGAQRRRRADVGRWPRLEGRLLAAVFAGGVGGGLARYGVSQAWPATPYGFPWATLAINTVGAFALALLVVLAERGASHRYLRPLLGTGFLGAFTTFSSVVVAVDRLAARGHPGTAAVYLAASLLAALAAGAFGLLLGRSTGRAATPEPTP